MAATVICRLRTELRRHGGNNRRPGRRHQFALNSIGIRRRAAQQFRGRGSGHRQISVLRVHAPAAHIQRRTEKLLDAQLLESRRRADNVHDRVNRADFVKMHFSNWPHRERALRLLPAAGKCWTPSRQSRPAARPAQSIEGCRKATGAAADRRIPLSPASPGIRAAQLFRPKFSSPDTGSRRRCDSISARLHPASTSAPSVMSPLIPEKQSK